MNESALFELLRRRLDPLEYVVMPQVEARSGESHNRQRRYADAIAVSLWQSRGFEISAYEIKSCRSDWLQELRDGRKAEEAAAYADRVWLVTANGVAKREEIPKNWGWLEANADGTALSRRAAAWKKDAKPVDRTYLVALLRRAVGYTPDAEAREAIRQELARSFTQREKDALESIKARHEKEKKDLRDTVARFERYVGHDWLSAEQEEILKAVGLLRDAMKAGRDPLEACRLAAANLRRDAQRAANLAEQLDALRMNGDRVP